jgi:hypothetical protein
MGSDGLLAGWNGSRGIDRMAEIDTFDDRVGIVGIGGKPVAFINWRAARGDRSLNGLRRQCRCCLDWSGLRWRSLRCEAGSMEGVASGVTAAVFASHPAGQKSPTTSS